MEAISTISYKVWFIVAIVVFMVVFYLIKRKKSK
jgi:hypothetical protein